MSIKKGEYGLFYHQINLNFDHMQRYISIINDYIEKRQNDHIYEFESLALSELYNEESLEELRDYHFESDYSFFTHSVLPQLHLDSIYLLTYSKFEDLLNKLCLAIGKRKKLSPLDKKYQTNKSLLEKRKLFLDDVNSNNLDKSTWDYLEKYSEIRNLIIHNNGSFNDVGQILITSKKKIKLYNWIKGRKDIKIQGEDALPEEIKRSPFKYYDKLQIHKPKLEITPDFAKKSVADFHDALIILTDNLQLKSN